MRRGIVAFVVAGFALILVGQVSAEVAKKGPEAPTPSAPPVQAGAPAPKVIALDTNKDGKPDRWESYDGNQVSKIEADTNFDGKVDEWAMFEGGKVKKVEKDTDYDGKADRWVDY